MNGHQMNTSLTTGHLKLNMSGADVAVRVGGVRLFTEERWGSHAAPGYLMDIEFKTIRQPLSGHTTSMCAVQEHGNNRIRQLGQHESLFNAEDYAARFDADRSSVPAPPRAHHICLALASQRTLGVECGSLSLQYAACRQGVEWRSVVWSGPRARCALIMAST